MWRIAGAVGSTTLDARCTMCNSTCPAFDSGQDPVGGPPGRHATMTAMDEDDRVARIDGVVSQRWDIDALRAGASVCATLAVPFRVLAAVVDSESGSLNALFFVLFVGFFVVGSGCAAWVQRTGTPLSHALVTALGTYVLVEIVFIVVRLARGTEVPWFSLFFTLSVISAAGVLGGFLGSRLQAHGVVPSSRR